MKYVASVSFGKDSLAMLCEIIKRKMPLDYIVFCDIKFNNEISGEHPLMAEWIPKAEKILKDRFGIDIIHLTAPKNFVEQFYTIKNRGNHKGDRYGFPYTIGAWCNGRLKLDPINKFINQILKTGESVTEYIGIAKDEPKRLQRYKRLETERHKYITLADLDISEDEAMQICIDNDLLSPKYKNSFRGGCWFCPKQSMADLYNLWKDYPEYFNTLESMEKDSFNTFRPNNTLKAIREKFEKGKKYVRKCVQCTIFDLEKKFKKRR